MLELNRGDGCTALNVISAPELDTEFKWLILCEFYPYKKDFPRITSWRPHDFILRSASHFTNGDREAQRG